MGPFGAATQFLHAHVVSRLLSRLPGAEREDDEKALSEDVRVGNRPGCDDPSSRRRRGARRRRTNAVVRARERPRARPRPNRARARVPRRPPGVVVSPRALPRSDAATVTSPLPPSPRPRPPRHPRPRGTVGRSPRGVRRAHLPQRRVPVRAQRHRRVHRLAPRRLLSPFLA